MIQPPYLKEGDKVALVSPAYWVPQEALQQAADTIRSWGLQPIIGPHTNNLNVNAYAGTADERAADLIWALEDDTIKTVVCSRGGYGSIHLLNRIPAEKFQQHPKWIIGHGDIAILLYAIAGANVMSIHGPMAFQIASSQEPATSITRNILFGTLPLTSSSAHCRNIRYPPTPITASVMRRASLSEATSQVSLLSQDRGSIYRPNRMSFSLSKRSRSRCTASTACSIPCRSN